MRPFSFTVTPATADPDGIADGKDSTGASVTLDGALTSGGSFTSADGLARQIVITDAGADDQRTATYTLTGTDADNNAIAESLAGPNVSATVTTTKHFKTLTAVTIASPVATSTVDIGTNGVMTSSTHTCDRGANAAAGASMVISGTCNVTLQETRTNIFANGTASANWLSSANYASKTASANSVLGSNLSGIRLLVNSFTAGASIIMEVNHPRCD